MKPILHLCKLSITDLRLWVHLGCSLEERANVQPISININLLFPKAPLGFFNDNLSDSICYARVVELIQNIVQGKSFNLIEHLTCCLYSSIDQYLKEIGYSDITLKIVVTKLAPPLPNIYGSVSFSYFGKSIQ